MLADVFIKIVLIEDACPHEKKIDIFLGWVSPCKVQTQCYHVTRDIYKM
jgi:hypothetical protein